MVTAEHFINVFKIAERTGAASNECLASRLLEQQVATLLDIFTRLTEVPEDDSSEIPELFLLISTLMEEIQAWGARLVMTSSISESSSKEDSNNAVNCLPPSEDMIVKLSTYNHRVVALVEKFHMIVESSTLARKAGKTQTADLNLTIKNSSSNSFNMNDMTSFEDRDDIVLTQSTTIESIEVLKETNQTGLGGLKKAPASFTCGDCFLPFDEGSQLTRCQACQKSMCSSCRIIDTHVIEKGRLVFKCRLCGPPPSLPLPSPQTVSHAIEKQPCPPSAPQHHSLSKLPSKPRINENAIRRNSIDVGDVPPSFIPPPHIRRSENGKQDQTPNLGRKSPSPPPPLPPRTSPSPSDNNARKSPSPPPPLPPRTSPSPSDNNARKSPSPPPALPPRTSPSPNQDIIGTLTDFGDEVSPIKKNKELGSTSTALCEVPVFKDNTSNNNNSNASNVDNSGSAVVNSPVVASVPKPFLSSLFATWCGCLNSRRDVLSSSEHHERRRTTVSMEEDVASLAQHVMEDLSSLSSQFAPLFFDIILQKVRMEESNRPGQQLTKLTGKALAVLLTTSFLDTSSEFTPLSQDWLALLIRSELGVMNSWLKDNDDHDDNTSYELQQLNSEALSDAGERKRVQEADVLELDSGKSVKIDKKRSLSVVLRKEYLSSIAIGCYLRLALQCGGLNNSVLSECFDSDSIANNAASVRSYSDEPDSPTSLMKKSFLMATTGVTATSTSRPQVQQASSFHQTLEMTKLSTPSSQKSEGYTSSGMGEIAGSQSDHLYKGESKLIEREVSMIISKLGASFGRSSQPPRKVETTGGAWVASAEGAKLVRQFARLSYEASKERYAVNKLLKERYESVSSSRRNSSSSAYSSSSSFDTSSGRGSEGGGGLVSLNKSTKRLGKKKKKAARKLKGEKEKENKKKKKKAKKKKGGRFTLQRLRSSLKEATSKLSSKHSSSQSSDNSTVSDSINMTEKLKLFRLKQDEDMKSLSSLEKLKRVLDAPEMWEVKASLGSFHLDPSLNNFNAIKNSSHVYNVSLHENKGSSGSMSSPATIKEEEDEDYDSSEEEEGYNDNSGDEDESDDDESDSEEESGLDDSENDIVENMSGGDEIFDVFEDRDVLPEEYYHALLSGGLFLHVICPALMMPHLYNVVNPPTFLPSSRKWWLSVKGNNSNNDDNKDYKDKGNYRGKKSGSAGSIHCRDCSYDLCPKCRKIWSQKVTKGLSSAVVILAHCLKDINEKDMTQFQHNAAVATSTTFPLQQKNKASSSYGFNRDQFINFKSSLIALCDSTSLDVALTRMSKFITQDLFVEEPPLLDAPHSSRSGTGSAGVNSSDSLKHNVVVGKQAMKIGKEIAITLQKTANRVTRDVHILGVQTQHSQYMNQNRGGVRALTKTKSGNFDNEISPLLCSELLSFYDFLKSGEETNNGVLTTNESASLTVVSSIIHDSTLTIKDKLLKLSSLNLSEADFESAKKFLEVQHKSDVNKHVGVIKDENKDLMMVSSVVNNKRLSLSEKLYQLSALNLSEKDFENAKKFVLATQPNFKSELVQMELNTHRKSPSPPPALPPRTSPSPSDNNARKSPSPSPALPPRTSPSPSDNNARKSPSPPPPLPPRTSPSPSDNNARKSPSPPPTLPPRTSPSPSNNNARKSPSPPPALPPRTSPGPSNNNARKSPSPPPLISSLFSKHGGSDLSAKHVKPQPVINHQSKRSTPSVALSEDDEDAYATADEGEEDIEELMPLAFNQSGGDGDRTNATENSKEENKEDNNSEAQVMDGLSSAFQVLDHHPSKADPRPSIKIDDDDQDDQDDQDDNIEGTFPLDENEHVPSSSLLFPSSSQNSEFADTFIEPPTRTAPRLPQTPTLESDIQPLSSSSNQPNTALSPRDYNVNQMLDDESNSFPDKQATRKIRVGNIEMGEDQEQSIELSPSKKKKKDKLKSPSRTSRESSRKSKRKGRESNTDEVNGKKLSFDVGNHSSSEDSSLTSPFSLLVREADILRKSKSSNSSDKLDLLEKAVALYVEAQALDPENAAAAYYGAGVCERKLGRPNDAIISFQQAISLDPSGSITGSRPGSLWENLAAAYLRLKQYEKAKEAYEQALVLEPDNVKLQEGLVKARSLSSDVLKVKH